MMQQGSGQLTLPPGFRFHPTDEELLHYYLRKKLAYEAINLDVIREVDVNKLEPWDLKDKCRVGSGSQNEWYFFSHKDKKYPTGTRTNRATTAGFWKATGRDKTIHLSNSKRIGMRKTLVFYTGRAPHGQKTDWIMHEYRLDDETLMNNHFQEDGWVVCRVFKKKNYQIAGIPPEAIPEENQDPHHYYFNSLIRDSQNNNISMFQIPCTDDHSPFNPSSIHLPQLLSTESTITASSHINPPLVVPPPAVSNLNAFDPDCSHSFLDRFTQDWSILDKVLASHRKLDQTFKRSNSPSQLIDIAASTVHRSPLQYLGCDAAALMKYSN